MRDDPFNAFIELWWFIATSAILYVALEWAHYNTALAIPIACLCWGAGMFVQFVTFLRRKPPVAVYGSVDFPPYEKATVEPMCRRCVHLATDGRWLTEDIQLIGTCNIDQYEITNTGYPSYCRDFYTGNSE